MKLGTRYVIPFLFFRRKKNTKVRTKVRRRRVGKKSCQGNMTCNNVYRISLYYIKNMYNIFIISCPENKLQKGENYEIRLHKNNINWKTTLLNHYFLRHS